MAYKPTNADVVVVIPTGGSPYAESIIRITEICLNADIAPPSFTVGNISAADSKSVAVKWFLEKTTAKRLIIFDHDVLPPLNFMDILKHDVDIVGAPYPIYMPRTYRFPVPGVFQTQGETFSVIDNVYSRKGLVECDMVVAGALVVKREVLEKIKPAFENNTDEWGILVNTEDATFCKKAKALGYKVYADFDYFCDHYTRVYVWKLMMDMAEDYQQKFAIQRAKENQ